MIYYSQSYYIKSHVQQMTMKMHVFHEHNKTKINYRAIVNFPYNKN